MKYLFVLATALGLMAFPAFATKAIMPGGGMECTMKETVSINVQYNFRANSFAEAKKMFDEQNAKVTDFAKKQNVAKFELQNQNYNIYAQPQNYGPDGQPQSFIYQVNGSSAYVMDSADAAFKFAEFLNQNKIQVGMNSNSYRQGNCNNYTEFAMPIEILMPALSPTMTEGNLAKWTVKEGDKIKSGQVIAEIETDKATMEVEAVDEGVIGKLIVAAGTEAVKVNQLIALLLEEGEDKKALDSYVSKSPVVGVQSSEKKENKQPEKQAQETTVLGGASLNTELRTLNTGMGGRVFASPLAKRIATNEGVPLQLIQGSGPHGRIVKDDVLKAKTSGAGARGMVMRNPVEFTKITNNNIRKVIARRLTESKQQVPHFYLTIECELNALLDVRKQINFDAESRAGKDKKPEYKLSVNDFIIKASGRALKKVPAANASWSDEAILMYNNVDVSVAVAIDGGLITPIVRNADQKSVIQISNEMKDLAARARQNKLAPEEFQGGTFSLSNLGMYGIKHFGAIVNPPQGCILAVGAGEDRVVVRHGKMEVRNIMEVTLSVDHRVVDGAVGAEFLSAFRHYIESPALLLI